jgi:hypothetical protein
MRMPHQQQQQQCRLATAPVLAMASSMCVSSACSPSTSPCMKGAHAPCCLVVSGPSAPASHLSLAPPPLRVTHHTQESGRHGSGAGAAAAAAGGRIR